MESWLAPARARPSEFWRYRAEAGKLPGARFARLRRARRHIEASFVCRWPRRTALGRPPADWETASGGLENLWEKRFHFTNDYLLFLVILPESVKIEH